MALLLPPWARPMWPLQLGFWKTRRKQVWVVHQYFCQWSATRVTDGMSHGVIVKFSQQERRVPVRLSPLVWELFIDLCSCHNSADKQDKALRAVNAFATFRVWEEEEEEGRRPPWLLRSAEQIRALRSDSSWRTVLQQASSVCCQNQRTSQS